MTLTRPKLRHPGEAAREPQRATYEGDFYTWTQEQGALLRSGHLDAIDRDNIAEEIETLGRSEFDKLVSFYALVMLHMLKWEHQPNLRSRSWETSIALHRLHAEETLADNPGLRQRVDEALVRAYRRARLEAIRETGLRKSTFPETCPFTSGHLLTRPYEFE